MIKTGTNLKSLPNTPLPPEPALTRWGTWIQAALFYAEHFDVLRQVVMSFEATDAQSIKKAQEFLNKANIKNELLYIKTHFKIFADTIEQLETIGLKLNQTMEIVEKVYTSLKNTPGKIKLILIPTTITAYNERNGEQQERNVPSRTIDPQPEPSGFVNSRRKRQISESSSKDSDTYSLRNTTTSEGEECSNDNDHGRSSYQETSSCRNTSLKEILPTPETEVKKVTPRRKTLNYKAQQVTKSLFEKKNKAKSKIVKPKKKKMTERWYCHICE
ncbi:hypothetical protein Zmor_018275 [Zophobas morio]|uniref:Uncharacterized protein n=1 Tax=Zophobas morio TaxID=2755281 RepID=A0AA38MDC9_9CUCU|nr:hypothetical protein Zmor_018275 [Zophobas morio]